MNILLAVDGSDVSLRAAESLLAHGRWFRDPPRIHVAYVHPPVPAGLATRYISQPDLDSYYRDEGEVVLGPVRALLESGGAHFTPHLIVGEPAPTLVKLAKELGCEMICLGTHGRGALGDAMTGSVAAKVLHLSPMPVLLVR